MSAYLPMIGPVIAGVFALVSAYFAYSLRKNDENRKKESSVREEKIGNFTEIYSLFESAMNQVTQNQDFTLHEKFSAMNAKMELLAAKDIRDQYFVCTGLLERWSKNHTAGSTNRLSGGVVILQAPDPNQKYRDVAEAQYNELQEELNKLTKLMRQSLEHEN